MGIGQLISDLGTLVPPWVLALVIGVALVAAAPGWLTGLKVKKVKALLRQTTRAGETDRSALIERAFGLAEGRPEVLVALVREADKMNLPKLRDRALKSLSKHKSHADVVRKLRAPKDPTAKKGAFGHPVEAVVRVRTLLDNGATELAREKLTEALSRFPDDPELLELRGRLEDA